MTTTTILKGQCRCPLCEKQTDLAMTREEKEKGIVVRQVCNVCGFFIGQSVFTYPIQSKLIIPKEVGEAVERQENVERVNALRETINPGRFFKEEESNAEMS